MSVILFSPWTSGSGEADLTGSPTEGYPNSHCLLHGPDQTPQDAPGLRPEAGLYLSARTPIYPTTHLTSLQRFLLLASETPGQNLENNSGRE